MTILLTLTLAHDCDPKMRHASTVSVSTEVALQDERDFVLRTTVVLRESRKHPRPEIRKMLTRTFGEPLLDLASDLNHRTYTYHPKRHPKDVLEVVRPLVAARYRIRSSCSPPDVNAVIRAEMDAFAATPTMLMTAMSIRRPGGPPEDLVSAYMEMVSPHARTLCWIYMTSQAWRMRLSILDLVKTTHLSRESMRDALDHIVTYPKLRPDWEAG